MPRIVALSLLEGVGLPWFQGLPGPFRHGSQGRQQPHTGLLLPAAASLRSAATGAPCWPASAPTRIVVGADDELFNADQFQPMMQAINPRIGVTVVPNQGHLSMIADPAATTAIAAAGRTLAGD